MPVRRKATRIPKKPQITESNYYYYFIPFSVRLDALTESNTQVFSWEYFRLVHSVLVLHVGKQVDADETAHRATD
jgi:hypothetical protein